MMTDFASSANYLLTTVELVSAYVSRNSVPASELAELIRSVHKGLVDLSSSQASKPEAAPLVPAVPIRKSIQNEFLICLEDGKHQKSLKRHLLARHGMTPDEYRTRWDLPHNYPMVAPAYAKQRSLLAHSIGLGRKASRGSVELAVDRDDDGSEEQIRGELDVISTDMPAGLGEFQLEGGE